jgi:hypothetical protein
MPDFALTKREPREGPFTPGRTTKAPVARGLCPEVERRNADDQKILYTPTH